MARAGRGGGRDVLVTAPHHHPLKAVLLFNLAVLLFACMDTSTKYLTASFAPPLVMAARYIGNLVLMLAFVARAGVRPVVTTRRTGLVWLRAACLACGSLFIALALQRMPVAEATAIMFLAPMFIVLAAGPLLGERIGRTGWIAAFMGFVGVLLIARPGSGLAPMGILFALASVFAIASYQLLSRVLAATEQTEALLFYSALTGSIVFGSAAPLFWPAQMPTLLQAALLAGLGLFGGIGHFLLTAAFRHAPASLLAPMNYLQLLWALLLGWLVFDHMPDALGMLGMGIVAASGVIVALRSHGAARALREAGGAGG